MNKIKKINLSEYEDDRGGVQKFFERKNNNIFEMRQLFISKTYKKNTVRGMHIQINDSAEEKLIFPMRGKAKWICIDFRDGNDFKKLYILEMDSKNNFGYYVPKGFAHGMISCSNDVELLLCASASFDAKNGINIDIKDPEIYPLIKNILPNTMKYSEKKYQSIGELLDTKVLPIKK